MEISNPRLLKRRRDQNRRVKLGLTRNRIGSFVCASILVLIPCAGFAQSPVKDPAQAQETSVVSPAHPVETPPTPKGQPEPALQPKDQLAADTAKLLQLATELKAEIDKSTKDVLSLSVIRKAQEVEKLAHKVRDEMKATMGN